jgi:hypothetical protein
MVYSYGQKRPTQRALDAGESARFSGIFHASAFFWLDGFAVPVPAQVTPAVGWQTRSYKQIGITDECSSR